MRPTYAGRMTATTQNRTGSAGLESADTDGSAHSGGSRLRIWIDGRVVDTPDEARVSALDHGLVVGDGVFEALKVTAAGPFAVWQFAQPRPPFEAFWRRG